MRSLILILCIPLLGGLFSCEGVGSESPDEPSFDPSILQGTWRMTTHIPQNETEMVVPDFAQYKIYTQDRFFLINYLGQKHQFGMALGGPYTINPDSFTEHIGYYSEDPDFVGAVLSYRHEFQSDSFAQSGIIPQEEAADLIIEEQYEKVEAAISKSKDLHPLIGVWKLEKAAYDTMKMAAALPPGEETYKVITPGHFYVIQSNPNNGYFSGVVFGTYKMENDQYIETVLVTSRDSTINGQTIPYSVEVNPTSYVQMGVLKTSEKDDFKIEEYFIRVE